MEVEIKAATMEGGEGGNDRDEGRERGMDGGGDKGEAME